jgi:hypothetical protein
LSIDNTHQRSRDALERLLDCEDHVTRREVAEVLRPILRGGTVT